jgi:hypothetical protein
MYLIGDIMAKPGLTSNYQLVVPTTQQETLQLVMLSLQGANGNYFDGFQIYTDGQSMLTVTRKFVPTWAIVVAVIGFFLFLLGLLALLIRQTESATITLHADPRGTLVHVTGVLPKAQAHIVYGALQGLGPVA